MPTALVIISCLAGEARGQNNSNPWPTTGNVGIGAASNPQRLLNIHGVGTSGNPSDPTVRLSWHSSTDDAATPDFTAHLSLITSSYNRTMYSYCRDFFGSYQTTDKDLVLQAEVKAGDIILANRCTTGYIRFATTPPPADPNNLQPGDLQDVERFAILPNGQVGVGTHSPYGKFDVNFGSWNCEFPKISFSNNAPAGSTGYTANPSIRFYAATGAYQTGDPPVPLTCEQYPARAWWLEAWNGAPGSFHIRSGVNTTAPDPYSIGVGLETPVSRMSFLGNGNVGVNNENPAARFQVTDGSVLFNGTTGATPVSGAGTRLMWIPEKAAFRAGKVDDEGGTYPLRDNFWDDANIGEYSFAFGYNCTAQGERSIALGSNAWAYGTASLALGPESWAQGDNSIAIAGGSYNWAWAPGDKSCAIGQTTYAEGYSSIVIGANLSATGDYSQAYGRVIDATGEYSCAYGRYLNATATNAFAIGFGSPAVTPTSGRLVNNIANTLMLGAYSNLPSITLRGGTVGSVGNVGVKTTSPCALFSVEGNAVVGSTWAGDGSKAPPASSLAVEGMVGIGTHDPVEKLSVIGGSIIVSDNEDDAIASDVDLAVRQKAVIGGFTFTTGSRTGNSPKLYVNGDAVKLQTDATWDIPSDIRYKKNVTPFTEGLSKLKLISPIWFEFNGKFGLESPTPGVGIVAQEMQTLFPYMVKEDTLKRSILLKPEKRYPIDVLDSFVIRVADFSIRDSTGQPTFKDSTIYSPIKKWVIEPPEYQEETSPILLYNPGALLYVLVNSIKELDSLRETECIEFQRTYDEIQSQNDSLKLLIQNLQDRVARLEQRDTVKIEGVEDVILEQNNPNPFSETATITYYIPSTIQGDCELLITTTSQSLTLKRLPLTKGTPTQLAINAGDFDTGVYVYSIYTAGKVCASKKMIIIH